MTPLPISLAAAPPMSAATAAPQSSLPADTATGDGQPAAMAFVEQLSKLLQPATLATQSALPEAAGVQPPSAPVPAQPDATPAIAGGQPEIILPQLPNIALPSQQPDAQAGESRCVSNSKPKVEPATPKRRAGVTPDQPAVPTVPALPAPDAIAAAAVVPPATRDRTAQHEPTRDQHSNNQEVATSGARPASSASQLDGPSPCVAGMDQQQPQDASPMQVALTEPPADASATVTPPPTPQPEVLTVRSAETTSTPASMSHANSPAAQIAPALMQRGHAPDGAQRLTVRLDPPELGHVQVKIDRPSDAPARVEITVQKQETLTLLLRDQPQLQRALDQAGVPADGRTVTFHIAASGPSMRIDPGTTPVPGTAAGGLTGDDSQGAARQHGHSAHQRDTTDEDEAEFTPIAARGWLRAGLDITA